MEITPTRARKNRSVSLFRQFFPNNTLLFLFMLMTAAVLFAGGTYYGSQLARTKQAMTLMNMVRGIVGENIQIVPNYINGLTAKPDVLYIDMKNNEYQKLAYLRSEALAPGNTTISQEIKNEIARGEISLRGSEQKAKAKFSLTGVNFDHIGAPQKWSLRVDLSGDDLLFGMNKFTLLVPQTRSVPPFTEWLNHRLEKHIGLISLNYEFVKVIINGKDLGIYALEEHFDKRLLERNERREGIILKLQERDIRFFKAKSIAKNPLMAEQARHIETVWAGFWAGDIPANAVFDMDKLAKYYALTDLVNGRHTHYLANEFFYLNPITRLLEPIAREFSAPYLPKNQFRLFVEDLNPNPGKAVPAIDPFAFHSAIFKDADFVRLYFGYLEEYSSTDFLNAFVATNEADIEAVQKILHTEFPYQTASPEYLFDQLQYITNYMHGDFSSAITAYQSETAKATLTLYNKHHFPVRCSALQIGEAQIAILQDLPPNTHLEMLLPEAIDNNDAHSSYISCTVPGIEKPFDVKVFPWKKSEALTKNQYPITDYADYADHPQIVVNQTNVTIQPGVLTLNNNLLVNDSQTLIVMPGAEINLVEDAFVLSYGPVQFQGTKSNPIKLFSADGTGRGLVVLNAKGQSKVEYTEFSNLRAAEFPGWWITAAVLFNESPVLISSAAFTSNQSEDALNIVRSQFEIRDSIFNANKSDAFDSDFSRGTIANTKFLATGNDAIDTSGSQVEIRDIVVSGAGDKGVSVGEASHMRGKNLMVLESGIAISSKDNSTFDIEGISLSDNALAFALFQKKAEYGPTHGVVRNLSITGEGEDYILEVGSSLQVDEQLIAGDIADAKVLMYGNVYGKKTIR